MGHQRDLARFMKYVEIGETCWLWTGAKLPRGYGRFYFDGKPRYAHRVSVVLHGGAVADDALVMHSCDNPSCVNPDHLSVGTQTENMRDAASKGRTVNSQDWGGEKNPKAKLTSSQRAELIARAMTGECNRALATNYGITITRVQQIVRQSKRSGGGWATEEF
ncbi:hypothetical protein BOC42_00460 [Burkholderia pseudomallei]|nr:hypothetical protein BOC42_00460 [Burkholderia pseudomallei]